uniref:Coiled-coil domain-containing protein 117 isoform X3 n=1 Tax=Geotrypetes seraphini TaxID=260995 RepID=A0A6P8S093_GEOSA|nr:coiled-coil domain-containing protein 117 isoform X3 [Geotrypetes seraphini]
MAGGVGPGRLELEQRPRPSPAAWAGARLHCGSAARLAPGISGHSARKHKREEEAEDQNSPVRKKRLTEALCSSRPVSESWDPSTSQKMLGEVLNQYNSCPAESVLESPFEEMEETAWEQQCEAARRKLKEIEDRLIDEDEVVEADHTVSRLPTLVLSDALKNGLKRELHEDLTKKIVECMFQLLELTSKLTQLIQPSCHLLGRLYDCLQAYESTRKEKHLAILPAALGGLMS